MSEKDKLVEQYVEQYKDLCEALGIIKPIDRIKVCVALAKIAELAKAEATKWYYPSKGELPKEDGEYFITVKIEDRGFIYALAIYRVDRGWLGLYNKPYAWQYIVPPKEEA